jgi:hypothetical protein
MEASSQGKSFWKSEVANKPLEYLLSEELFSIQGDAYEGFTRIWKGMLGGRKQLNGRLHPEF